MILVGTKLDLREDKQVNHHSLIFNIFFNGPYLANFIFVIFLYVIASIAYIHPVYGAGVRTQNLLIMSRLP